MNLPEGLGDVNMPKYVDTNELESTWTRWLQKHDDADWERLSTMVYRICDGVSTRFNPRDEDEHLEHTHDATAAILAKIYQGKLRFTPGKAPVFNLLTTTAFHLLFSKMNKQKRSKQQVEKYRQRIATKFIEVRSAEKSRSFLPARHEAIKPHFTTPRPPCQVSAEADTECDIKYLRHPHAVAGTLQRDHKTGKKSVEISCVQCSTRRRVFTCDLHQVKFCVSCTAARRRKKR